MNKFKFLLSIIVALLIYIIGYAFLLSFAYVLSPIVNIDIVAEVIIFAAISLGGSAANILMEKASMAICNDDYCVYRTKFYLGIVLVVFYGLALIGFLTGNGEYTPVIPVMLVIGLYFLFKYKSKENCHE